MKPKSDSVKPWLIDLIHLIESEFEIFINRIPTTQRENPTHLKNWSPKDEINHLVFWNNVFIFNIKARQKNQPILDPKNYLVMNDIAWFHGKDKTWKEIRDSVTKVFKNEVELVNAMSIEELIDADTFTLGYSKSPKPFIEDFLYEIVDHPLHHILGMYERFGDKKHPRDMLLKVNAHLQDPVSTKWTSKSRKKVTKYL